MKNYFRKIMIVDDSQVDRFILQKTFKMIDQEPVFVEAENGVVALEHLADCLVRNDLLPDIIFLDFNMPVLDGLGFLAALKQHQGHLMKNTNIILVIAPGNEEKLHEALKYENVYGYFLKPVSVGQILKFIERTEFNYAS